MNPEIKVKTCLTKPEIEILIIINEKAIEEFYKVKSKKKPSEFCKQTLRMSEVKETGFIESNFNYDVDKLIEVIRIYKSKFSNGNFGLYDLLE